MNFGNLTRREALSRLAILLGGALIGEAAYLSGGPAGARPGAAGFSAMDLALMDEIGETIIPATSTPGAKAALIGGFMAMMVRDCYDYRQQAGFKAGLLEIDARSGAMFGDPFLRIDAPKRTDLLNALDAEQRLYTAKKSRSDPDHYFRMLKQLAILGYFTSEIGCTQALRFTEVPGAYRGDEPYKKGDRAWFIPPSRSV